MVDIPICPPPGGDNGGDPELPTVCGQLPRVVDPDDPDPPDPHIGNEGDPILWDDDDDDPPWPHEPPIIFDFPCPCVVVDFAIGPIYREEGICYRVIKVFRDCKPVGTPDDPGFAPTIATLQNDGWSFVDNPIRHGDTCDCDTGSPCVDYSFTISKPCPNEIDPDVPGDGGGGGGGRRCCRWCPSKEV